MLNRFEQWMEAHHYVLLVALLAVLAAIAVGVNLMAYEQHIGNGIGQSIYEGPASHPSGGISYRGEVPMITPPLVAPNDPMDGLCPDGTFRCPLEVQE